MPFDNLGPAEDAYFAAGITDAIIGRLAAVRGLGVISRTSTTQYDRTGKTLKQIGADLGVSYVLEGTVRWGRSTGGAERVRITPQLVRVADDTQLWAETYNQQIDDIFDVQSTIATQVIDQLGIPLLGDERAVELDPEFLEAWAFLSMFGRDYEQAAEWAEKIPGESPYIQVVRAFVQAHIDSRLHGVESARPALAAVADQFESILQAAPGNTNMRQWLALTHARLGNADAAIREARLAIDLSAKDRYLGPKAEQDLAAVYAEIGRAWTTSVSCGAAHRDPGECLPGRFVRGLQGTLQGTLGRYACRLASP